MSGFYPIIQNEQYANGLFPVIPPVADGTAVLLTDGKFPPVAIDSRLSIRRIRNGKYSRKITISTAVHQITIPFRVMSKNDPYQFDVSVSADVRVSDPIIFFNSRITDAAEALRQSFSADIRRAAKTCAIRDFNTLDDEIYIILHTSDHETVDTQTGIAYQVTGVETRPDKDGMERIKELHGNGHSLTLITRMRADSNG